MPRPHRVPGPYRFAAALLRPILMVVTRRDWSGTENLPRAGGFVVCPNHISYFDPLAFAHFMWDAGRPTYFLGKESIFRIPVVGAILLGAGQIPVHRGSAAAVDSYRSALAAVREGKPVGIFPEGTITRDPDLWPMRGKTGAARVALETGCPLVPVAQWGPQDVLSPYSKRLHLFARHTMHIRAGEPVDLSDLRERPIDRETLRVATDRLMDAITSLLEQIRQEQPPGSRVDPAVLGLPEIGDPLAHAQVGRVAASGPRRPLPQLRPLARALRGRLSRRAR